jgi:hypothetical protein
MQVLVQWFMDLTTGLTGELGKVSLDVLLGIKMGHVVGP